MAFTEITDTAELNSLFEESSERSVILFKHSLTCPISHGAYEEMSLLKEPIALVVVQDARSLSNEIANRTGVRHESPQAIILRDGAVAWHSSHGSITKTAVVRALEEMK